MKNIFNDMGDMILFPNEKLEITLEYNYSKQRKSNCPDPNNWIVNKGVGNDGKNYTLWYCADRHNKANFSDPDEIVDENDNIIYRK